jgi:hypothetical protein
VTGHRGSRMMFLALAENGRVLRILLFCRVRLTTCRKLSGPEWSRGDGDKELKVGDSFLRLKEAVGEPCMLST